MPKLDVRYTDYLTEALEALGDPGCLLVAQAGTSRPNPMTIGWGTLGIIWGRPIFEVLVRPSRHTWGLLEKSHDFTVNVLPAARADAAMLCGTKSGRDMDKFAEAGLTPVAAQHVDTPIIRECIIHFECRIVHKNNVDPTHLVRAVRDDCYAAGDFHTIYYGQIVGVQADDDAPAKLRGS